MLPDLGDLDNNNNTMLIEGLDLAQDKGPTAKHQGGLTFNFWLRRENRKSDGAVVMIGIYEEKKKEQREEKE